MKKRFAMLVAFAMFLSFTACGSSEKSKDTSGPPSSQVSDSEPVSEEKEDIMTVREEVLETGMVPISGQCLKDGVYPVEMKSSSPMFKADHCELSVSDGRMEVTMYMTGGSNLYLFYGTSEDAAASKIDDRIPLKEDDQSFTFPLEALDAEISCAVFSSKKEQWYERALLFRSDSLPFDAFADGYLITPESLALTDGKYTAEVALKGGTGKAKVASPAKITVDGGQCYAEIIWSSSNYDYVRIGNDIYKPINTDGNSTFLLPVTVFDFYFQIIADTTAMSQPHEIAYTLRFDSGTLQPIK